MSCRRDTLTEEASTNLYLWRHKLRRNRGTNCNALNRHLCKLLAQRLLIGDRDGTDSRDRARRHAPGEAHGHLLARNFSVLGKRGVACSRPRKCRSVLQAEFVDFARARPRGTCRAGKRGAQHRLSSRGFCLPVNTLFPESDPSVPTDSSIDSPLPAKLLRRVFFGYRPRPARRQSQRRLQIANVEPLCGHGPRLTRL